MPLPVPPPLHEAPLPPEATAPDGSRTITAIAYAAVPGYRPLELDLHLPPRAGAPYALVVFLHGGGWRMGSRRSPGPASFEPLLKAGLAVASVDYRLSAEACWPAQLHDAKAAVRFLRARAGEIGVDPDRISAWGESAGGHLACLLGLVTDPTLEGEVGQTGTSSRVSAVAAWYPPTQIALVGDPAAPDSREALLLGAPAAEVPEVAAQASPVTYAAAGDAPPFLLLHGNADRFVPAAQSTRLHDALKEAGNSVEMQLYDNADHMWHGSPEAADDALKRTVAFLIKT